MKGSFSYQLSPSVWAVFHHCDRCSSFRGRFAELCGNSTRIIQELQESGLSTEAQPPSAKDQIAIAAQMV
jgi:hypothetical protein